MKLTEITGDSSFDKTLSDIEQKAKDGIAFHTKVRDTAESMPEVFAYQRELESWIRKELARINNIPNLMLQQYKSELDEIAKDYTSANLLDLLYFHATDKNPHGGYNRGPDNSEEARLTEIADTFIENHRDDIKDTITSWLFEFKKLAIEASKKDWPTGKGSWQHPSVSRYSFEKHDADRIAEMAKYW